MYEALEDMNDDNFLGKRKDFLYYVVVSSSSHLF